MKVAFVHDHKFPYCNDTYYESPGFDNSFIERYHTYFDDVLIVARSSKIDYVEKANPLRNKKTVFFCISSYKEILSKRIRNDLRAKLLQCDCAIIRLPSLLGVFMAWLCRKENIPYLMEVVACPWDSLSVKSFPYKIAGFIYYLLMKKTVIHSKYTVYVSEEFLQKRYPSKGKQTNISNVFLHNYGKCDLMKRKDMIEHFNKNKSLIVGNCGSLAAEYKSQEDVIKIMPSLIKKGINVRYQLVGDGKIDRIKRIAEEYNVADRVEFLGEMKHDDVFEWLDTIDVYVHPSKQEGLCRAVVEAMSRGCPIIAADAGGIHEQIEAQWIFKKGNVASLEKLIESLNVSNLKKMSMYNYQNAEKYKSELLDERRKMFFSDFKKKIPEHILNDEFVVKRNN